ncbi:MAG: serine hydrolase domain-containing protein [Planctomycetota bacterium]
MTTSIHALALVGALLAPAAPQQTVDSEQRFPASTALEQGLSPIVLDGLGELVQSFVDDGKIVGAELMVLKNGRTVLHEGYGWRDREAGVPMEPGGVFCVRSMTKPVAGAALSMLLDERKLRLDDRVAEYLPAFEVDGKRDITVEHVLTHTSGLPMSLLLGKDLKTLDGIRAVADLGAESELLFAPGEGFHYSDQGTDTVTALIEVVSGVPAEEFVRTRVLEPLGMGDSACVLPTDHPLRARACSKYTGSPSAWNRYWKPDDEPLFPFFLGSQGLYSTLEDYARFLDLYMKKGRVGKERLLKARSVRRTLQEGAHPMEGPTGFPGLRTGYGSLMVLYTGEDEDGEEELVAFGHSGSDGTYAWAFPEQRAIVLYFTQSRGTPTGLEVEERLGELLLGVPFDPIQLAPPLEEYLGYYREGEGDRYRAIVKDGDDLALEVLGKAVVPLTYLGEDRWKLQPGVVLEFDRSEDGVVTGYHIGVHREFRFEPAADLPTGDEIAARVAAVHAIDRLESAGTIHVRSKIEMEKLGLSGSSDGWFRSPEHWRVDEVIGEESGRVSFDGETVHYHSKAQGVTTLSGPEAAAAREGSLFARFGDWRAWAQDVRVIQRIVAGDDVVLLVRAGDTSSPAPTFYVDEATGRVGRVDCMTYLENLGRIGQTARFGDFEEVGGALIPHRTQVELAHPLIGPIRTTIEHVEVGVDVPDGHFGLKD